MTTSVAGAPASRQGQGQGQGQGQARARHARATITRVLVILIVGAPVGAAAAWTVARVGDQRLLTALTTVVLCLPAGLAAARLRRSPRAVVPFIVALGLIYFFVPRLLTFDPSSGLVSNIPMTPGEIEASKTVAQGVLIAFALPIALVYRAVPMPQHPAQDDELCQETLRSTLRVRTAIVLGVLGSLVGMLIGLTMGTRSRNFESAGAASPLNLVDFFTITAPAALWLAGFRRISVLLLVLSVAGPYLRGGRQDVLTPLIVLLIAVIAAKSPRAFSRRRVSVKAIALVMLIVVAAIGATIATTSRRATSEGGHLPPLFSTLVVDQTLFDPLLIAIAREQRPQGPQIYGRVLTAPIPRAVWHEKPFSYDYEFRQRHFPHDENAIPISLAGTSFVSLLVPGVVLAGWLVALLALAAESLLGHAGQRSILVAAVLAIFVLDLIRIGGMYRELLTFVGSAVGAMLITRARPSTLMALVNERDGGTHDVHVY